MGKEIKNFIGLYFDGKPRLIHVNVNDLKLKNTDGKINVYKRHSVVGFSRDGLVDYYEP